MGLFDKKICSICGGKAGGVLARKLEDGYICTQCFDKLSDWSVDRKELTADEARAQIEDREENQKKLEEFKVTKAWGVKKQAKAMQFIYDDEHKWFVVVQGPEDSFRKRNPDIIRFDQVRKVTLEIDEGWTDPDNKFASWKRYSATFEEFEEICWHYDFYLVIDVKQHPYIKKIRYQMNGLTMMIDVPKMHDLYGEGLGLRGKYTGEELRELNRKFKILVEEGPDNSKLEKVLDHLLFGEKILREFADHIKVVSGHIARAERIQRLLGV